MKNLAIMVSGRGSNMVNIVEETKKGNIKGRVKVVISNKADAPALEKAKAYGIDTYTVLQSDFSSKSEYDKKVIEILKGYDIDLVVLAGYMKLLTKEFVDAYPNRIVNIHPALLPSFRGLDAQKQAFDFGVKIAGCTVHFVDEGMDTGKIIAQRAVIVDEEDTVESLTEKILKEEHKLYPYVVKLLCEDRVIVEENKIRIKEEDSH